MLLWAAVLRLILVLGPGPSLSDDLHRYVWEGRLVHLGIDPWDHAPDSPELAALAATSPEWASVNHRELPAIYPPGAQLFFGALTRLGIDTVRGVRAVLAVVDLALIAALLALLLRRRQPAGFAALYAWHPLAVVEVGSSGHYEPLALLPLVLGLLLWERRRATAFLFWGLALSTKLVGAAPAWFAARWLLGAGRPRSAALGLAVVLGVGLLLATPFALDGTAPLGSLGTYARHWGHNASVHRLLTLLVGYHPARWVVAGLFVAWAAWLTWKGPEPLMGWLGLFAGLLVLSPVVHPWYGLWLLILVPLVRAPALYALTGLLPLAYLAWTVAPGAVSWEPPAWVLWVEYGLPAALALAAARRRR